MLTREVLRSARKLITHEDHWTKDAMARNADGRAVKPTDKDASSWCALGAIIRSGGDPEMAGNTLDAVAFMLYGLRSFNTVNDYLGHKVVLKVFDHAIMNYSVLVDAKGLAEVGT